MKSVIFSFVTHNHQPIGNFDNVIEEAYQKSYLPFFERLEKYPEIKIGTHFTGPLLDWLKAKHPEWIEKMKSLVSHGQLSILTGGFYEPILSVFPFDHQTAQIAKLSEVCNITFG